MRRWPVLALFLALAACGGSAPPAPPAPPAPEEAVARVGDITVRASTVPTATLSEQVARQYGIDRDERTLLLLVGLRRGPEGEEVAVPGRIQASVATLGGPTQPIALRELRNGEWLDYVGTVKVTPPETLRFELSATADGGGHVSMQFNREIYPH